MEGRRASRGVTLIEAMVSIAILALIGSLIYGAFDGMSRTRNGITKFNTRYHQGRTAIARMAREIQSAFVSLNGQNTFNQSAQVRQTAFIGKDEGDFDRLDFTAFAHRRVVENAHESDQCEVGYFGSRNPDTGVMDLVRREDKYLDMAPDRGGVTNVLAEDVQSLNFEYYDDLTSEWLSSWDTLQATGQPARLPMQVRITLVLNGGPNDQPIVLRTRVTVHMQNALDFTR